jgi:uncharacterized membrane protein
MVCWEVDATGSPGGWMDEPAGDIKTTAERAMAQGLKGPVVPRMSGLEKVALGVLVLFTVVAVVGFGTFGRNPGLVVGRGAGVLAFYGWSFVVFSQGQVWLAGLVLMLVLWKRAGWAWLWALVAVYGISLAAELGGTIWGIPFGAYSYGSALGLSWLERVPVIIPLSWFYMAVPSYALAMRAFPGNRLALVAYGSLVLLAWDLALDPAMSYATRYWRWAEAGPYYGMPLVNLAGWYATGVALLAAMSLLRADGWLVRIPFGFLAWYYGVNLLMPLGMCVAAGLWGAVVLTLAVVVGAVTPVLVQGMRPAMSNALEISR